VNIDEYNNLGSIIEKTSGKDAVAIEKARQEAWNISPLMRFFRAVSVIEFLFLTLFVVGVLYHEKTSCQKEGEPVVEKSVVHQAD